MAQEKVAFDGQKLETAGLSINQASSSSAPIEKDLIKGTPIGYNVLEIDFNSGFFSTFSAKLSRP